MRKFSTVALREYRTNIKSKTFLIAMGIMPIFMFGTIFVSEFLEDRVDTAAKRIAVVDRTGKIFPRLLQEAKQHNTGILDPESGEPSPYILVRGRLEALIARAVFYDLVALGVERGAGDDYVFGVWSGGHFFSIGDPRDSA